MPGASPAMAARDGPFAPFLKQPARFDTLSRPVPALPVTAAQKSEREAIDEIAQVLGELNAYVGDFHAGLSLLDHAEANAAFAWSWGPIACRDAGAALTSFRDALKRIEEALKRCPALKRERRAMRAVERQFSAAFPSARARRNGRARNGEKTALPRPHDAMSDAALGADVSRNGRRVAHARDGRETRFELSEHSLWRLVALRNEAFAVFEDALD